MEVNDTLYKPEKWKKKRFFEDKVEKKLWKASGGGNIYPIFYKFQDRLVFYEKKNKSAKILQSRGTYSQIFENVGTLN